MSNQHTTTATQADTVHAYLTGAPGSTRAQVAAALSLSPRQVGSALTNLVNRGRVTANALHAVHRYTAIATLPKVCAPPKGAIKSKGAIVMDYIEESPGVTQAAIVEATGLDTTAVNGAINQLKLVERITYQAKHNKHYYYPAPRARTPALTGTPVTGEEAEHIVPRVHMTKAERQDLALAGIRAARKIPSLFFSY